MKDRTEALRRRIAYYRRLLSEGADADLAQEYLRQITSDQNELDRIEKDTDRRS